MKSLYFSDIRMIVTAGSVYEKANMGFRLGLVWELNAKCCVSMYKQINLNTKK